jgi:hypothetical protein
MVSAYFVLPGVGSGTEEDPFRPKYVDNPNVDKWYGGESIEKNGENFYPVRVFAAASELQLLADQPDAFHIPVNSIEDSLNGTGIFPVDLSAREWALLFSKFLMQE